MHWMVSSSEFGTRAFAALHLLVDALLRTHWSPQQSMVEFMDELDDAVSLLDELKEAMS
jgi:hypothetical protein